VPTSEFEFFARSIKFWMEAEWQSSNIWEGTEWDRSAEAKDAALNELRMSLALTAFAQQNNITLPPHLVEEVREEVEEYPRVPWL
jgi:hypothetical protein